jgi:hypothetical protein
VRPSKEWQRADAPHLHIAADDVFQAAQRRNRRLKTQIGSKAAIAHYVKTLNEERRRQSADAIANRAKLEVRLSDAERGGERLIDTIVAGTVSQEKAAERMPGLQAEVEIAKAALASCETAEGGHHSSANRRRIPS